jgi:recombinational DNA repair protein RecT
MGLEPDGRDAHLIPFRNGKTGNVDCTLIVDYKGIVKLVLRSGLVSCLHADLICENDMFVYDKGQVVKHLVDFRQPRGEPFAVYSLCHNKDGTESASVMSLDEVKAIRARSKSPNAGPWVTDFGEMAKKTIFKRLSKWLTLSPEIHALLDKEDLLIDIDSERVARPTSFLAPPEQGQITAGGIENPTPPAPAKRKYTRQAQKPPEPTPMPEEAPPTELPPGAEEDNVPFDTYNGLETPQSKIANILTSNKPSHSWDDLVEWNADQQFIITDLSTLSGFDDLPTSDALKLLGSHKGLLTSIQNFKMEKAAK